jgi:hypothetical protein
MAQVDNRCQTNGIANSFSSTSARIIESVGYYQSVVQSNMDKIVDEIDRLCSETANGDSKARKTLESKHEDLSRVFENLEEDLADYNLAMEQARSGTGPDDVRNSTLGIVGQKKGSRRRSTRYSSLRRRRRTKSPEWNRS